MNKEELNKRIEVVKTKIEKAIKNRDKYLNKISEENKRLRQEIERLNQEKERIYASTSWKVTKPVRWLGKNLKRGNTGGK